MNQENRAYNGLISVVSLLKCPS